MTGGIGVCEQVRTSVLFVFRSRWRSRENRMVCGMWPLLIEVIEPYGVDKSHPTSPSEKSPTKTTQP